MFEFMNITLVMIYSHMLECAITNKYNSSCCYTEYTSELYWLTYVHIYCLQICVYQGKTLQ